MSDKRSSKSSASSHKRSAKKGPAKKSATKNDGFSSNTGKGVRLSSDLEDSLKNTSNLSSKISSKSGGKSSLETPFSKDLSGGKHDGAGNTGDKSSKRPSVNIATQNVELEVENDIPETARCLMDCEAAMLLRGIQEHLRVLSDDPSVKVPDSFLKGLKYAESGPNYTSSQSVREALETLKVCKVSEGEMCVIANACPETVDEAYSFLPSLEANKAKNEGAIKDVLSKLVELRQSPQGTVV